MQPFLSVYGHVTLDQIISVKELPKPNHSLDILTKDTKLGGTGTDIAVRASALGVPTALCSFVGNDFPEQFTDFIRSKGVITDELVKVDDMETSQAIIINDTELTQEVLFFQGPQGSASKRGRLLTDNAKRSKFVHFCTGEPRYYISVMREIKGSGALIALDPSQEVHRIWDAELFNEAYGLSDVVFCNEFESESIKKYLGVDSVSMINCPLAVCTRGTDGCDFVLSGQEYHMPIIKAEKAVDATGAGDAFRAGFYAGQYHGLSIEESIITAASSASFAVEAVGALANIPTWDQVMERADTYLKKV